MAQANGTAGTREVFLQRHPGPDPWEAMASGWLLHAPGRRLDERVCSTGWHDLVRRGVLPSLVVIRWVGDAVPGLQKRLEQRPIVTTLSDPPPRPNTLSSATSHVQEATCALVLSRTPVSNKATPRAHPARLLATASQICAQRSTRPRNARWRCRRLPGQSSRPPAPRGASRIRCRD